MRVSRLELTNFRTFSHLVLEDIPEMVVLVSPNGLGKSSILEAIAGTDPAGNAPSTGQVRWEMTVPAGIDPSQLRAADNAIPVLEMDGNTGITARPGMGRMIRVTLIDKVTGERIGQGAKVPLSRSLIVEGAIEVWPGYIIVGGPYGAVAFRTSGERPAPRTRTRAARSGVL